MSSKSHEFTATVADMINNKRLSEQEEIILKWAVDEVHNLRKSLDRGNEQHKKTISKLRDFRKEANTIPQLSSDKNINVIAHRLSYDIRELLIEFGSRDD